MPVGRQLYLGGGHDKRNFSSNMTKEIFRATRYSKDSKAGSYGTDTYQRFASMQATTS